ncbi:hypothetical protein BDQ17DRAFT_1546048 [Cyathus striatus]|nr:hypothetical protein BDQ17DRAFT_1546048 [Cyathus striatus]
MSLESALMSQLTAEIVNASGNILASRYLAGAALAAFIWDHLTTLDREVHYIWKSHGRSKWVLKCSFAFNRYGNEAFFLFIAYVITIVELKTETVFVLPGIKACAMIQKPRYIVAILAPMFAYTLFIILLAIYNALEQPHRSNAEFFTNLYKDSAKIFLAGAGIHFVNLITAATSSVQNFLIPLFALWALGTMLTSRLHFTIEEHLGSFVIAVSVSQTFAIKTFIELKTQDVLVVLELRGCVVFQKPRYLVGIIAPLFGYTLLIVLLAIYNALEQPHRSNAEFFTSLYRDSGKIFLALTVIHFVDLVMTASSSVEDIFILLFLLTVSSKRSLGLGFDIDFPPTLHY